MAKQKGIIKIKGSLGGITFYQSNGQDLSRTTNGPSKSKINNDPAFARTRENNQEFAGATAAGKALRMGLVQDFDEMADTIATARIMKMCKAAMSRAAGVRGQRPFQPVTFKDVFVNFPFSEAVSFDSIFLAPYSTVVNAGRTQVTMTIPDFNAGNSIHAPSGATHFKVINLISVLSQYTFNTTTKKYEATDAANNTKNGFAASGFIPLGTSVGAVTTIVAAITPAPVMIPVSALISCVGIEFYQLVSGTQYLLASSNAMKIKDVF
jgi:hypothetical protein